MDEHKNVLGTETKEEASHFYMKCSENKTRSADFHIVHYDNKPYYLSTNCNIFGCCKGPLNVTKNLEQAQFFCIYSEDRCLCPCNRLDNWSSLIEVPMRIFCSHHNFCMINGYISIKKIDSPTSYNTSVVVGRQKDECGALFQLENIAVQSKKLLKSNISATSNSAIELQIEGSINPDTRDETSLKQSLDSKPSDHDEPSLRDQKPLPDIPSEHGPLTDTQTKKENPPFPGTLSEHQPRFLPDTPDDHYTLYGYEWAPLTSAPSERPLLPDDPRNSSEIFPLKDAPSEEPLLPDDPREHSRITNAETMIEILPLKDTPSEEPLLPDDPREHSRITNAETMIEILPPKDTPSEEPLLPDDPREHSRITNAETMIEILPPKDAPSEEPLLPDDPREHSRTNAETMNEMLPPKDAPSEEPLLPDDPREHSRTNAETMIEMLPPKDAPSEEPLLPDDPREHSRTNAESMIEMLPPKDAPSEEPLAQIRYYDSKHETTRSNGVISLTDILSVDEAEPQVVPSLKTGEGGFFFNVSAQCIQGLVGYHGFVIAGGHSETDLPFDGIERLREN